MKMINALSVVLISFLLAASNNFSQTITSKTAGGHWNEPSTWNEGIIPGASHDVIINGPVVCPSVTVNSLTINASGSVEDECCAGRDIYVTGNLINYGTIKNTYGGLGVHVGGSVTNNGTMNHVRLRFNGTSPQQISGSNIFKCSIIEKEPSGSIIAANNILIDSLTSINLHGDTLNMGNFKLTRLTNVSTSAGFRGGLIYSNGEIDVSGLGVMQSDLAGEFTLVGNNVMEFTNITVHNNLRIGAGKIIQDEPSAGRTITVKGNVINEGTIRNGYGGLNLYVEGNVINNGTMIQYRLRFSGTSSQQISGTNIFKCALIEKEPGGSIIATSNILIDSLTNVNLHSDTLNMGNLKLTRLTNISTGAGFRGGLIYSNGEIDVSGLSVMQSDLAGSFTLVGNNVMEFTSITVHNNLRIGAGKIIQDEPSAGRSITVKRNLINEGTIRNGYGGLNLYVEGNVINNGTMTQYRLRFSGASSQQISGANIFKCALIEKEPHGIILAASDIKLDSLTNVHLYNDTLNMGSYKLSRLTNISNNAGFRGGLIYSDGDIDVSGINVMQSDLAGDFTLVGNNVMEFSSITIHNNLRTAAGKIIQDECCAGRTIYVNGNLINEGTIRNGYGGLSLIVSGNINNAGEVSNTVIIQRTKGKNVFIAGEFGSRLQFEKTGDPQAGKTVIMGTVKCTNTATIASGAEVEIPSGTGLILSGGVTNNGQIINKGTFTSIPYLSTYSGIVYSDPAHFMDLRFTNLGSANSLEITTVNAPHPQLITSAARWWKVVPNAEIGGYIITLRYDDSMLNGNSESTLEAYNSTDSGITWQKISHPLNTIRDTENNSITIGNSADPVSSQIGEIVLTSGGVAGIPNVAADISGRRDIRVGPPNRYTVVYWNNSNIPVGKSIAYLNTTGGVKIKSIITTSKVDGSPVEIPVESFNFNNSNEEALVLLDNLEPKAYKTFDVILLAEPGTEKLPPQTQFITGVEIVIGYIVIGFVVDYVIESAKQACIEYFKDEQLMKALQQGAQKAADKMTTTEGAMESIMQTAVEEVMGIGLWPANVVSAAWGCFSETLELKKVFERCLNPGSRPLLKEGYMSNEDFDCNSFAALLAGNTNQMICINRGKELRKVTSWDPNAKEGPTGYGDAGFIASANRMFYTIFFENKKEATAPAWKIVIIDTLDQNVYDVNSVQFGAMSHSIGVPTREGNILKWEFVDIELPPHVNPPEGEGWVKFSVNPKVNLPTGTQLNNKAVITFDLNPPIETNAAINTLDFDPPVTIPYYIMRSAGGEAVELGWNANDGSGSGISSTQVYMAVGDGPFTLGAITNESAAIIPVTRDLWYKFYVLSMDNVGNVETDPAQILEIFTSVEKEIEIPKEFRLEQNYPNPFNPTTTIRFAIPQTCDVTLEIYDILGRRVTTLMRQTLEPGYYNIKWNADDAASGVYFYTLRAGSFNQSKKLLLLK